MKERHRPFAPLALTGGFKLFSFLLVLIFWGMGNTNLPAQSARADDPRALHKQRYAADAGYRMSSDIAERRAQNLLESDQLLQQMGGVASIPVVIHLMYLPGDSIPNNSGANLSEARVMQGMDWLNDAFRNAGAYAGGPFYSNAGIPSADTDIEFCLANYDDSGQSITGVYRVETPLSNLYRDDPCEGSATNQQDLCLKGLSNQNSEHYLNIWLVNQICSSAPNIGCGIKGYAFPPGAHGQIIDGIVLEAQYWGNDEGSMTEAIQLVGHYLNLLSTSNDPDDNGPRTPCDNGNCALDGDKICDTPPSSGQLTASCATGDRINSCASDGDDSSPANPFSTDVEDLYENFMAHVGMACRNSFTNGQKQRMWATLLTTRKSLLESEGCAAPPGLNAALLGFEDLTELRCDAEINGSFIISNTGSDEITSIDLRVSLDKQQPKDYRWTGSLIGSEVLSYGLPSVTLPQGPHRLRIEILSINDQGRDANYEDDFLDLPFVITSAKTPVSVFPLCFDFENGTLGQNLIQADFDQVVGFDVINYSACGNQGNNILRYNTAGAWSNGSGVSADEDGTRDLLITGPIDLRDFNRAELSLDLAHRALDPDRKLEFEISASDRCDGEFEVLFSKSYEDLNSSNSPVGGGQQAWMPAGCEDWSKIRVDLSSYTGGTLFLKLAVNLESERSQNLYLDNICLDASVGCNIPTAIPMSKGLYLADRSCTGSDGWTHFWKTAAAIPVTSTDVLLLSVKDLVSSNTNLLPEQVMVGITDKYGKGEHDLSGRAGYAANAFGWYVSGRYFKLWPAAQPEYALDVRLYFDEDDAKNLGDAMPGVEMNDMEKLVFFSFDKGMDPDPAAGQEGIDESKFRQYFYSTQAGEKTWTYEDVNGLYSATIQTDRLSGGGMGSGGAGMGRGAMYPRPLVVNGVQDTREIELRWDTDREINSVHFEIWHSQFREGPYEMIGLQTAGGMKDELSSYLFEHEMPGKGFHHYILRMYHEQGPVLNSDTLRFRFDENALIKSYPNPSSDKMVVKADGVTGAEAWLRMYSGDWIMVYEDRWIHDPNALREHDVEKLPAGIYFLVIRIGQEEFRGKFIKQ